MSANHPPVQDPCRQAPRRRARSAPARPSRAAPRDPPGGPAKRAPAKRATKRATPKRPAPSAPRLADAARPRPAASAAARAAAPAALRRAFTAARGVPARHRRDPRRALARATSSGSATRRWSRSATSRSVGVTSGDREQIVGELTRTPSSMTTLHVDPSELERAAGRFPTVAVGQRRPELPPRHADRGHRAPAGADRRRRRRRAAGRRRRHRCSPGYRRPIGTRCRRSSSSELPTRDAARAATPLQRGAGARRRAGARCAPLIEGVRVDEDYGVVVTLRGGIELRFGSGAGADAEVGRGGRRARRSEARRAHLRRRQGARAARPWAARAEIT